MLPLSSPFRVNHEIACRLGRGRTLYTERPITRVYGTRKLRFPLMALMTSQDLGPARHAIAQRVVAGTFHISYPFSPARVSRAASPAPQNSP